MTWLQRFAVRLAARIAPPLRTLFRTTDQTLTDLATEISALRMRADERRSQILAEHDELFEALSMAGAGGSMMPVPFRAHEGIRVPLRESADLPIVVKIKERMWELELALEDRGWRRQLALAQTEFSRYGIGLIILMSRLYYVKNPLIRRGVTISSLYVFGRGMEISSPDEAANEVLQAFCSDPRNKPEIGHAALTAKNQTLWTDGNLFWCLFADPSDGQVIVRTIDALEIEEIVTDPDDASVEWLYHRRWTAEEFIPASGATQSRPMEQWYCALGYDPGPDFTVRGQPLASDKAGNLIYVLHRKVGGLEKWHFGCPRVYPALDWSRAYKAGLEDYASRQRALSRFAWDVQTAGGTPAIAALKQTFATTLGIGGTQWESNPPPVAQSTWISGPGVKMQPMKTAGTTDSPDGYRRFLMMVASCFGLGEHFFGDASVGSLATAQSLDRPTELMFLEEQEMWREMLQAICTYALESSERAPRGRLKEAIEAGRRKEKQPVTIDVKFPSILEHDIAVRVKAIVEAMTLDGYQVAGIDEKTGVGLLLAEVGVEDVQKVLDEMYPEAEYDPDRTAEPEPPPEPPPVAPGVFGLPAKAPPAQDDAERAKKEAIGVAVRTLRRALRAVKSNGIPVQTA